MKFSASIALVFASVGWNAHASAETWTYFCPHSNVVLELQPQRDSDAASSGNSGRDEDANRVLAHVTDCSTKQFLCESVQMETRGTPRAFRLVAPRIVHKRNVYEFEDMRLVTRVSRFFIDYEAERRARTITVWQTIDGKQRPIEETLDPARGLVVLDGLQLDMNSEYAEACVLQSATGPLAKVRFRN
jgi:hypothetical protein